MQDYIRTSTYQRAMLANLIDFHDKVSSFSLSKRGHCCNTNLLVAIKQQISYWLRYTVHSNFNKFHPYKICMCISPGCVRCWCWVRDPVVLCCSGWSQKSVRHRSQQYGHPLSGEESGQQWLVSGGRNNFHIWFALDEKPNRCNMHSYATLG